MKISVYTIMDKASNIINTIRYFQKEGINSVWENGKMGKWYFAFEIIAETLLVVCLGFAHGLHIMSWDDGWWAVLAYPAWNIAIHWLHGLILWGYLPNDAHQSHNKTIAYVVRWICLIAGTIVIFLCSGIPINMLIFLFAIGICLAVIKLRGI